MSNSGLAPSHPSDTLKVPTTEYPVRCLPGSAALCPLAGSRGLVVGKALSIASRGFSHADANRGTSNQIQAPHHAWTMGGIFLYALWWIFLSIITLGIATFFLPYAWGAKFLNGTQVYGTQGEIMGVLKVEIRAKDQLGHMIGWILLSLITVGIAIPFYQIGVIRTVLNHTSIVDPFAP